MWFGKEIWQRKAASKLQAVLQVFLKNVLSFVNILQMSAAGST